MGDTVPVWPGPEFSTSAKWRSCWGAAGATPTCCDHREIRSIKLGRLMRVPADALSEFIDRKLRYADRHGAR